MRRNWTQIFAAVPDITARLLRTAVDGGDTVWTEWEMSGTRRDGTAHLMRGVFIFGIADGRVAGRGCSSSRSKRPAGDMNAALRDQLAGRPSADSAGGTS